MPRLVTAAGITGIVGGVGLVALATLSPAESRAGRDPARAVADRPVNTERPLVRGNVVIGRTVRTTRGRWRGGARLSYVFRWSRCDHRGGSCSIVTGATGRVYVVGAADVGRSLRSVVVATNAIGRATAVSSPTPVVVRPGTRIRGIAIYRMGDAWRHGSGYERYAYVVVGRAGARDAATRPGLSLVYHSGTSVNTEWDSGVPYSVARTNGWLLRDAAGEQLVNVQYPTSHIGDVGSDAYRSEFARRVGNYAVSVGVDGVYIDDVVADISTLSGRYPAKYPNQASWEDAMAGFVQVVGAALKARGLYVLVNARNGCRGTPAPTTDRSTRAGGNASVPQSVGSRASTGCRTRRARRACDRSEPSGGSIGRGGSAS